MRTRVPELLTDLKTLVMCESPSSDPSALSRGADVVARIGATRLGVEAERVVIDGCVHLRWRLGTGPRRVLLLGHYDTVWPIGSLVARPFAIDGDVLRGPGCFDMKAGVAMIFHAVAALGAKISVTILITADEEIGSPSSRALIEAEAAGCSATLVLEGAADGGALKIERKGISLYELRVLGRAAHAGLEPERGINATVELAHQVLAVQALADLARGTTVTPTLMSAGSSVNTVPGSGSLALDVRVRTLAEQTRVHTQLAALAPALAGASIELHGGPNRPPFPASASCALFTRARDLADELGMSPVTGVSVGGASDGNFTAGVGVATLDGLGAVGGGAHADGEHVLISALAARTALVASLVANVLAAPGLPAVSAPTNGERSSRADAP
ncbi:MAG: Peptidase dimerization domain protein [Pseudonocardiales bacterium]|nr:Peptidase dimerization domain protein [Pseudonocardiales bacterium]